MGGSGAGEIEVVSAHSDADTVHFSLGGLYGGNHRVYVTLQPWRMADFATKKTVLVPVGMRVSTTW